MTAKDESTRVPTIQVVVTKDGPDKVSVRPSFRTIHPNAEAMF
jgi:hypothetical protein